MIRDIHPIRTLQWGLLFLLVVCIAQMLYWTLSEIAYTTEVTYRIETLLQRNAQAAIALHERGSSTEEILSLFDHIDGDDQGRFEVSSEALYELHDRKDTRINRFVWEGGFFVLVLVTAMAVVIPAIRRDAELRRRQQNFLAAVSHEFKSPLASIQLAAETMSMRTLPEEQKNRVVRRILDDSNRLQTMVTNILDTTLVEESGRPMEPVRVDLSEWAHKIVAEMSDRANDQGVQIELHCEEGSTIRIDENALSSVLRNLLDNAIKACTGGQGDHVSVRIRKQGRSVDMMIEDNGRGFEPQEADRIFDKFYRPGDEMRRSTKGSGLGLYLVRRFVTMSAGQIEAQSEGAGRGAKFSITWPSCEPRAT